MFFGGRWYLSGHHVDVLSERNLSRPKMSKAKALVQGRSNLTKTMNDSWSNLVLERPMEKNLAKTPEGAAHSFERERKQQQQQASQTPCAVARRRPKMQQQKQNSSSSSRNLIAREGGGRGRRRGSGAGDSRGRRLRSAKHGCREGGVPAWGSAGDGRRGALLQVPWRGGDEEDMLWARLARRQCLEAEVAGAGR
ncbi:hypothetical protein CFC21_002504 [Triticum aestivum]|uniref:Uncharacterized protein n=1 Tax=Triticum aestivum TaxID=4565 RepID=A0A3B5Y1H6_WHEAT|nr:hypothetical protein CFC21_002504 [Triticum aestivum]